VGVGDCSHDRPGYILLIGTCKPGYGKQCRLQPTDRSSACIRAVAGGALPTDQSQLYTESTGPDRHGLASPLSREAKGGAALCAAPVGPCGQVGQGESFSGVADAGGVTGPVAWRATCPAGDALVTSERSGVVTRAADPETTRSRGGFSG